MATTTPNYGWVVPTSTDLVKDGATAIETLGDSIDASFVGLKGGTTGQVLSKTSATDLAFTWVAQDDSNAIQNAIVDAKGDLIGATAADTPARLAVGTNGQILTADSTAATGLAWATPTAGGMTLLNTGGTALSGTSTSVSVTVTGYNSLTIYIKDAYGTVDDVQCSMRINGDTGSNYSYSITRYDGGASVTGVSTASSANIPYIFVQIPSNNTVLYKGNAKIDIFQPAATDNFGIVWQSISIKNGGFSSNVAGAANYNASAAISSISFAPGSGSWSGGTVYVYGVK
jgi:hypothetical protein